MINAYILALDDEAATLERAGGKGASLARLAQAGLPVPDGFHVTTDAYRQIIAENALQAAIVLALRDARADQPATLERASAAIAERFEQAKIPAELEAAIRAAYVQLPGAEPAVAVRSSATAEDLPGLSFAGQQDTYLNVQGADAVIAAVRRCWASLWTARAIGYRLQHAVDQRTVSLAVVVQILVPAEAAGILFTANPVNGRRDQVMITATWGLGEAIVGGQVTPDTFVIDKADSRILERVVADKQTMTVRAEAGVAQQPVAEPLRTAAVLTDAQALELLHFGDVIERLYQMPMDIEWALSDGRFSILQARPITALPEPAHPVPTAWPRPHPKSYYARASLAEHVPNPVSPLFATLGVQMLNQATRELAERMFDPSAIDEMDYGYQPVNGYLFMSIAFTPRMIWVWAKATLRLTRGIFRNAQAMWQSARKDLAEHVARWEEPALADLPAEALVRGAGELMLAAGRFYTVIQAGTLPTASSSEITFGRVYALVCRRGDPRPEQLLFGADTVALRADKSLFDLAHWTRSHPPLTEYLRRATSREVVAHLHTNDRLEEVGDACWTEWRRRLTVHIETFGRTAFDFDFVNPTLAEKPETVVDALRAYLEGRGQDPYERQRRAEAQRDATRQAIRKRLTWIPKRWFERALNWALEAGPAREDSIADMGLGHRALRALLLELGRRLTVAGAIETADDIFWLVEAEVQDLAGCLDRHDPITDRRATVAARKAEFKAQRQATPPVVLPEDHWMLRLFPWGRAQTTGRTLKGLGTSPGTVTATARVLLGPEDFDRMHAGDVLVAVTTTPAWTPLFTLASAVVTDIGGPLSHSSIVAREYGIPAVMATGNATRRIHDGDLITVDGAAGTVVLAD